MYKCEFCNKRFNAAEKKRFCSKGCENKVWVENNRVSLSGLSPEQREVVRTLVATFKAAQNEVSISTYAPQPK